MLKNIFTPKKEKEAIQNGYEIWEFEDEQSNIYRFKKPKIDDVIIFIDQIYKNKDKIELLEIDFIDLLFVGKNHKKFYQYLSSKPEYVQIILGILCEEMGMDVTIQKI